MRCGRENILSFKRAYTGKVTRRKASAYIVWYDICGGVGVRNICINGGRPLCGSVKIQGAKNSVLPILAATILSDEESIIEGCPSLSDVDNAIKILRYMGCNVISEEGTVAVYPENINCGFVPEEMMGAMRSSIIFLGAALSRCGRAEMSAPGGCELGARPIDLHIKALRTLGVKITESGGVLEADATEMHGGRIHLDFPSVGATENIMLAAVRAKGTTIINNAAKEPEIWDLQEFLNKMGAKVSGAGSDVLVIEGTKKLHGARHRVIADRIVAATYLCACMMCGGKISLKGVQCSHFAAVTASLRDMGAKIDISGDEIILTAPARIKPVDMLRTMPYPGFPTDAQAPITAALSLSDGVSVVAENIFENRFKHCAELAKMGADISTHGNIAVIKGVRKLSGAPVCAMELRGGAALIIAGAAASGSTTVTGIEHIERGYEDIAYDLGCLGADIKKMY